MNPGGTQCFVDFWCAVIIVGLLAGVAGLATTVLLHGIEHLTYHYTFGTLLDGVRASRTARRVLGPMVGGALAGLGWWLLRRHTTAPSLGDAIASDDPMPRRALSIDAALQVLLVGSGASLGREGAPRQVAAALGDWGTAWIRRLTEDDRRILCAESCVLRGRRRAGRGVCGTGGRRAVLDADHDADLASACARRGPDHLERGGVHRLAGHPGPPILDGPGPHLSYLLTVLALLLAPVTLAVGLAFNRLMAAARRRAPTTSWVLIPGIAAAGLATGICSHWWPELPGNGRSIRTVSLNSSMTLASAAVILVLKPVLTALFLRAGAVGGMLTPSLATGAAAGSLVALAINAVAGPHVNVAAVSLAGAAGVLAVTQRAPIWAALFVWELARPPLWLVVVFLAAALGSYGLKALIDRVADRRVARSAEL